MNSDSEINLLEDKQGIGAELYKFVSDLYPINRSITGDGVRKTLSIVKERLPELNIHEIATGEKCFDWEVPKEWNIRGAKITGPNGETIVDFEDHNLHVVNYSIPVDKKVSLSELQEHLYSLPDQPTAIPYVTSYYTERWGFCMSHEQRESLQEGEYHVQIDSELKDGSLTYADLVIPGETKEEILISTYTCHPQMASNELSGPSIVTKLAENLSKTKNRYTYRFVFCPETIGAIIYLSQNLAHLRSQTKAGFQVNLSGDNNSFTFVESRNGETIADRVALHVLRNKIKEFKHCTFLERCSDERQYCAPGIDLPVVGVMRTKTYAEYHTSLDNLDYISEPGLFGSYAVHNECIQLLEQNYFYKVKTLGEPQLGKRGLRPTLSGKTYNHDLRLMMDFLAYADGTRDLLQIAEKIKAYAGDLIPIARRLAEADLVEPCSEAQK